MLPLRPLWPYIGGMGLLQGIRRPFRYRIYHVNLVYMALSVAVFLACNVWSGLFYVLGLSVPGMLGWHFLWQPISYMFCHASWNHLIFNLLGLYVFGGEVERRVGSNEYLLLSLFVGVGAGLFTLGAYYFTHVNAALVGISGMLFGLMLAFAVFYPDAIISVFGIIPVRAPVLVLVYAAVELGLQLFSLRDGVAHLTHLSGLGFAWAYIALRYGINPWQRLRLR